MPIVIEPPKAPPVEAPKDDGSNLWELLYASLAPLNDPDPDETLLKFCQAWCLPLQPVYNLVREKDGPSGLIPSWGDLFDPGRCPPESLPYLAQWVGVGIQPEWSEEQIRAEIAEPTGWKRGQLSSIKVAGGRHLTGTRRVILRVNTPEVGYLYVRTLKSETPDEALTEADIRTQKPAWMVLSYEAIDGVTVDDVAAGWETVDELAAAFTDVNDLAQVLPDELPEP